MLAGDLAASERRLLERLKAEREKTRQKTEKERILADRQRARQQERDEEARQRKLELVRLEEEAQAARERVLEENNGVVWSSKLIQVAAPPDAAASKGIKRAADKILLPPSAGVSLLNQEAMRNGAYFFELKHPSGRSTHAGLLEFTAAEGFVALPRKVARCLWGPNADPAACEGELHVSYKRLPKATRAVFQPRSALFQETVGEGMREALEKALFQHSALTVGDWIEVEHEGQVFDLRVRELEPAAAVSVIDTEVEAEVHPSVETEERIVAEELEAQRRLAVAAAAAKAALDAEEAQKLVKAEELARKLALMAEKTAGLPPEPPVAGGGAPTTTTTTTATCLFRFPDGTKHTRRFSFTDPVQILFDFVDSKGASGYMPGQYRLVTQYPRHVFDVSTGAGEIEIGSTALGGGGDSAVSSRQVLFLEAVDKNC